MATLKSAGKYEGYIMDYNRLKRLNIGKPIISSKIVKKSI